MDTRTKEAIRYLGYGSHAVDDHTLALVESSFAELDQIAGKRIIYRIFDVSFKEADRLQIGKLDIISKNLGKNLAGCQSAVILGDSWCRSRYAVAKVRADRYGQSSYTAGMCSSYAGRISG